MCTSVLTVIQIEQNSRLFVRSLERNLAKKPHLNFRHLNGRMRNHEILETRSKPFSTKSDYPIYTIIDSDVEKRFNNDVK